MKRNVLYFPYIRVPESPWFTRMLLYWDRVSSIVPVEYTYAPERLGEYMRSLVERQLVEQVLPMDYLHEIPNFRAAFEEHLKIDAAVLEKRRHAFAEGRRIRIHVEKTDGIDYILKEAGLAEIDDYPWFQVEEETGNEFMAYLATSLGALAQIDADPVSDNEKNLAVLGQASIERDLEDLRCLVLEDLFPAPRRSLSAEEIAQFRDRHGALLGEFRRNVEELIIDLAKLEEPLLRDRRIGIFRDEIRDNVEEIERKLEEDCAVETVLSKLWTVLLAAPGVPPLAGLANAIVQAFRGEPDAAGPRRFAYAARAQIELA